MNICLAVRSEAKRRWSHAKAKSCRGQRDILPEELGIVQHLFSSRACQSRLPCLLLAFPLSCKTADSKTINIALHRWIKACMNDTLHRRIKAGITDTLHCWNKACFNDVLSISLDAAFSLCQVAGCMQCQRIPVSESRLISQTQQFEASLKAKFGQLASDGFDAFPSISTLILLDWERAVQNKQEILGHHPICYDHMMYSTN